MTPEDNFPNAPVKMPEDVPTLHRALLRGCGLQPMRASDGDGREWWDFMQEMRPLEDTEEGGFRLIDLIEALAHIRKQNDLREPKFRTKLVPTNFLRDPAKFRDLVLDLRRKKRERPRPKTRIEQRATPGGNVAVHIEPAAESEPASLTDLVAAETAKLNAAQL